MLKQDHNYSTATPTTSKRKLNYYNKLINKKSRLHHNALIRENRMKKNCKELTKQLNDLQFINAELKQKLQCYDGKRYLFYLFFHDL